MVLSEKLDFVLLNLSKDMEVVLSVFALAAGRNSTFPLPSRQYGQKAFLTVHPVERC